MAEGLASTFSDFVAARYPALVRSAFLLVGDRGHAEDLVQSALYQTFRAWGRLRAIEAAEAYTRMTMIRLAGRWSLRRWRGGGAPGDAAVWDPATSTWARLPSAPAGGAEAPVIVWTGQSLLIWGQFSRSNGTSTTPLTTAGLQLG